MERLLCLGMGYVFGLFQTAYFYGKAKGIDIRQHGSGNSGTTNALRVLGPKAGIIVLLGDCLKCVIPVALTRVLFGESRGEIIWLLCIYAATGAILAHDFPFYMGFKGGKGFAATAGLIFSFHPYFIIVGAIVFFGIFFTTHYVSVGSLMTYVCFLAQMIVLGQNGFFTGMSQAHLIEMYCLTGFLAIMSAIQHRQNIKRLFQGTERKTYLTKKNEQ